MAQSTHSLHPSPRWRMPPIIIAPWWGINLPFDYKRFKKCCFLIIIVLLATETITIAACHFYNNSLLASTAHPKHLQPKLSMPQLKLGSKTDSWHSALPLWLNRLLRITWEGTYNMRRDNRKKKGGQMPDLGVVFNWTLIIVIFFTLVVSRRITPSQKLSPIKDPASTRTIINWIEMFC